MRVFRAAIIGRHYSADGLVKYSQLLRFYHHHVLHHFPLCIASSSCCFSSGASRISQGSSLPSCKLFPAYTRGSKKNRTDLHFCMAPPYNDMDFSFILFKGARGIKTLDFAGTKEVVYERSDWPLPKLQAYFKNDTLALIGYGSQGHGQGLNARDNGLNVIVGVRKDGESWRQAVADGWVCKLRRSPRKDPEFIFVDSWRDSLPN